MSVEKDYPCLRCGKLPAHRWHSGGAGVHSYEPDRHAKRTPAGRAPGLYIIFDGPPSHDGGRFVEVEDADGKSVGMNGREWRDEGDGTYSLGPFTRGTG